MTRGAGTKAGRGLCVIVAALALLSAVVGFRAAAAATLTENLNALRVILPNQPVAAPSFSLDGIDSHPLSLAGLRGRVVFLNFWATWCVPCREEMPAMERLHQAYRNRGLAVVAVNFKESEYEVRAFMEELHLTFPAVLDRTGAVTAGFAVRGLPATYVVDRDGKILWKALGIRRWDGPDSLGYFARVLAPRPR